MLRPLAGLALVAALSGCASDRDTRSAGGILSIDVPAQIGDGATKPVEYRGQMTVGERFEVRLGAASGTGYAWTLAGPVPANMQLTSADPAGTVRPAEGAEGRPGGPSWTVFGMNAVAQGTATFRFVLARPWESAGGAPPARQVDVTIEVAPRK